MARIGFAAEGEAILLVGAPPNWGTHLGQSIYLRDLHDRRDGPPPPVDLALERRVGDFVRKLIRDGIATAVHDLSDGGLAIGLAEMAIASGIGATIDQPNGIDPIPVFFGEDQARYLVTVPQHAIDNVLGRLGQLGISAPLVGTTGGSSLTLGGARAVAVSALKAAHEEWFPTYMAGEAAPRN